MRVPRPLAWLLLLATLLTAGLLRQFHSGTPRSPFVSPLVGSLLFAAVFLLLLVAAREWRLGPSPGRGVRFGSLAPILLMLLVEKWISIGLYPPVFVAVAPSSATDAELDAYYRALAGAGLLLSCLLLGAFSPRAASDTWRMARPSRWLPGALAAAAAVLGTYGILRAASAALGGGFLLGWPSPGPLLLWVAAGQALRALAEEAYYRGLLMMEMRRLAPRLGLRGTAARRWAALLSTSVLFAMEHLTIGPPWGEPLRQAVFVCALGLLLGMLVLITENLLFAAGVHAWINWLLLGVAPHFRDAAGRPVLPAGTYVGLTLALAFVIAFAWARLARKRGA